jgi:hypothetical protein
LRTEDAPQGVQVSGASAPAVGRLDTPYKCLDGTRNVPATWEAFSIPKISTVNMNHKPPKVKCFFGDFPGLPTGVRVPQLAVLAPAGRAMVARGEASQRRLRGSFRRPSGASGFCLDGFQGLRSRCSLTPGYRRSPAPRFARSRDLAARAESPLRGSIPLPPTNCLTPTESSGLVCVRGIAAVGQTRSAAADDSAHVRAAQLL